jgi:AcrR family transcriptional regulator
MSSSSPVSSALPISDALDAAPSPSKTVAPAIKLSKPRDAAASKQALFDAAKELFGQKGFERTTLREIGELAGVDAAMIARYFGAKGDLYVAVVASDWMNDVDPSTSAPYQVPFEGLGSMVESVLRRSERHGPGPIIQALMRLDTSEEIRHAGKVQLERHVIDPLAGSIAAEGLENPQLRAEVTLSALLGISLARSLGWFDEVAAVPREELVELVTEALSRLAGEQPGR